ncbi:hypothetical protein [Aeromonas enteropelogenes]|uniref:hypothetical protein n=1 Tax=Aeromonas enteropelogenes TaxID=29489 RepID=UPI003B9F379B
MRKTLLSCAIAAALAAGTVACTSIITYIRSDNSTGTARCEPETDTSGVFSVRRDCIINQPGTGSGGVTTSTKKTKGPQQ